MSRGSRRAAPPPDGSQRSEWLMQPRWLPAFRAALGVAVIVSALAAGAVIAVNDRWHPGAVALVVLWCCYGAFLVWAGRLERSGTRLTPDLVVVTSGARVDELRREDILDLRHDQPAPHAWRVQAVLRDGRLLTLLGVPPAELDRLRRWHLQRPPGGHARR